MGNIECVDAKVQQFTKEDFDGGCSSIEPPFFCRGRADSGRGEAEEVGGFGVPLFALVNCPEAWEY